MDNLGSLEIYIPVEAAVKSIPLWSLPNSVLRRMGLPLAGTKSSRKLEESPAGIWICPVMLRKKGQKKASPAGNSVVENMSSLMGRELQAAPGPLRMSFVSSNHAAYNVLKETLPGTKVSEHTSHMSLLPPSSAPQSYQDAVVVYEGRIYLSIRTPNRSQSQQETPEPVPGSQSSKSPRVPQSTQASVEPAAKEPQKKREPQITLKQLKTVLTKTQSTSQERLKDNSPKKKHACKARHSESREDVTHGRDASSPKTVHCVPQATDGVHSMHSHLHKDARGEQDAEEAAGLEEEVAAKADSEILELSGGEAQRTCPNIDMDSDITIRPSERHNIVQQSNDQSWSRMEPQGAACAPTSLQQVDFKELAQEEKIARMKAKLRQSQAALSSLQPS